MSLRAMQCTPKEDLRATLREPSRLTRRTVLVER